MKLFKYLFLWYTSSYPVIKSYYNRVSWRLPITFVTVLSNGNFSSLVNPLWNHWESHNSEIEYTSIIVNVQTNMLFQLSCFCMSTATGNSKVREQKRPVAWMEPFRRDRTAKTQLSEVLRQSVTSVWAHSRLKQCEPGGLWMSTDELYRIKGVDTTELGNVEGITSRNHC